MKHRLLQLLITSSVALHYIALSLQVNGGTTDSFQQGVDAYHDGEFAVAARAFSDSISYQPTSGALLNLGLSEWRRGRTGPAMLAWEQVLWFDPFNTEARNNLEFARTVTQIESPELTWYEAASKWLPTDVWAWLTGGSLWLAIGMITIPTILRWRKTRWQQAVASVSLGVFLVSVPAQFGIITRSQLGFILQKNSTLLLTPTHDAESIATLTSGEPVRAVRTRGKFVFIRTQRGEGWILREQLGLVCPRSEAESASPGSI